MTKLLTISDLSKKLNHASDRSGEKVWQLPLDKEFDKLIDSPIADCQNILKNQIVKEP